MNAMDDIENKDFMDTPLKTELTYWDIAAPWKDIGQLKFLLGVSVTVNIISLFILIYKFFS